MEPQATHPRDVFLQRIQRYNWLYDFYGALLTSKQRACFTLHYMEDHSLSEIGAQLDITPQAVVDLLKRTTGLLERYENALGLMDKYRKQNEALTQIKACAEAQQMAALLGLLEGFPL